MQKRIFLSTIFSILSLSITTINSIPNSKDNENTNTNTNSSPNPNLRFLENENKNTQNLCCQSCKGLEEKYYSIDPIMNFCGECCMEPKWFYLYKVFEWTLKKAETNSPCADRNYTLYKSTPTHGVWPVTMTLDLYDVTQKELKKPSLSTCNETPCKTFADCAGSGDCNLCLGGTCAHRCMLNGDCDKL